MLFQTCTGLDVSPDYVSKAFLTLKLDLNVLHTLSQNSTAIASPYVFKVVYKMWLMVSHWNEQQGVYFIDLN